MWLVRALLLRVPMLSRLLIPAALVVSGALVAVGCSSEDDATGPSSHIDPKTKIEVVEHGFESDDPSGRVQAPGTASDGGASVGSSSGSSSGGAAAPSKDSAGEATRAVSCEEEPPRDEHARPAHERRGERDR